MSSQRMWSRQPAAHSLLAPHSVEDGTPFIDSGHTECLKPGVHITGDNRVRGRSRQRQPEAGADAVCRRLQPVVRQGPRVMCACSQCAPHAYWITSVAWNRSVGEIVRPRAFAVLRLMTRSNFTGCSPTGLEYLVHRRLVRTKKCDRFGIKERQLLRHEHAGHALRRIDPEEGISES